MKEDFLKKWNLMTNEMQKSLQSMMDLNAKTLQNFSYLKPGDLSGLKQPGDLLGKHLALTMENSQKILDYMHRSFQILESALLSVSKEIKENPVESFVRVEAEFEPLSTKVKKPRAKAASAEKKAKSTASATKKVEMKKKEDKPKKKAKASELKSSAAPTVAKKVAKPKVAKIKAKPEAKIQAKPNLTETKVNSDPSMDKSKQPIAGASLSEQENKLKNPLQK
ncbi:hypothetical protein BN59_03173 [Legionella massiliensis]|uniref:Phasin domain-containing protein n=1 Tax=Legionella massiliensis TaxID=1034943 RepID=A0A078L4L4_9GAMM|nr:hypothetical protein [Legionella massiliensis]CDZ78858.1 hypothetical protein BN59_03173 [Legionella massiliensis]CEE14596.1 hypothetical protein BN1094_03173 [Legionella massiliensis]